MKKSTDKRVAHFPVLRTIMRVLVTMLAGVIVALLAGFILFLNNQSNLSVWHTTVLDVEFTTDSPVKNFKDYLSLEDRLFAQLDEKVYAHIRPEERNTINRYNSGSLSDPARWPTNWNRSFEFTVPKPVAGVLLLHGLSDSPYSLRRLGQKLSASGVHVLGLRIPGHGTAPSGLVNVKWEDMAGAVRLSMGYLKKQLGDIPLYMVGYSNGGALTVQYILSTLENASLPRASGVVLISPEIGVAKVAAFAVWQGRIGRLLGLPKLAWNSVLPEYDPFKYNSFAVNAGDQAYRLTTEIQNQITKNTKSGVLSQLPPIMAFQSVVDATVRVPALIEGLFDRLPQGDHELVLFDINRLAANNPLVNTGPRDKIAALLDKPMLSYRLSLVSNESASSRKVAVYQRYTEGSEKNVFPLSLAWPAGIYSLSHVALPFAPDDPLYGGNDAEKSPGIQIGNVVLKGENGVLRINPASLLRLHWNPFYDYLEQRVLQFMALSGSE
ncbi:MAG: alpha/beta fold hydrolase [Desulfobacterales bacterium]|nr:alpha/beta fold hydrolase [Desulfobacterales bacterium]